MASKDLFDDIVQYIKMSADSSGHVYVSEKNLKELYNASSPPPPRAGIKPHPVTRAGKTLPPTDIKDISAMNLEQLRETVVHCRKCKLCEERKKAVFGEGNPDASLMFIGEGPGYNEDTQGLPFVGKAGKLLTKMINAMRFTRQDVFITNVVKCRPPGNRNPEPDEATACLPYLIRQIELIKPRVIVLLGAVPLLYLLKKKGITSLHGTFQEYMNIKTIPTFHPAYLLRNPAAKREAWNDLKKVMKEFGKTPLPVHKRT